MTTHGFERGSLSKSVALLWILAAFALSSCAGTPRASKTEDEARRLVPVPICLQRLPRRATPGSIVSLEPREYWSLLLPGFDPSASVLDLRVPDCSGQLSLTERGGAVQQAAVHPDELVLASGSDGFKVAWLPWGTGQASRRGLLALLRQRGEFLEVYALGTHQGSGAGTRLSLERMGPALVVTALEEHCRGAEGDRRCDASCTVYLMSNGRLGARAQFPVDHVADASVAPAAGAQEYRFSASADYRRESIALSEKLSVVEKGRGEVRSMALERSLRLQGERLVPSSESLWAQTARQLGLPESP